VGTYDSGKWEPESDHGSQKEAARRAAWLNGAMVRLTAAGTEYLNTYGGNG
jgi:hypothetical protein